MALACAEIMSIVKHVVGLQLFLCVAIMCKQAQTFPCTVLRAPSANTRTVRARRDTTGRQANVYRPLKPFTDENIWPEGIVPFRFASDFKWNDKKRILRSMRKLEGYTCIRFKPVRADFDQPHLLIGYGDNCASYVGRQSLHSTAQPLNLPWFCLKRDEALFHELLHVLGFNHEQGRADRGNFVKVKWNNIPEHLWTTFEEDIDAHFKLGYRIPYDYSSLLHYGPYDYAKSKAQPTMVSKQNYFQVESNKKLSHLDIYKVNVLYNCTAHLRSMQRVCTDFFTGCRNVLHSDCGRSPYISMVCRKSCGVC